MKETKNFLLVFCTMTTRETREERRDATLFGQGKQKRKKHHTRVKEGGGYFWCTIFVRSLVNGERKKERKKERKTCCQLLRLNAIINWISLLSLSHTLTFRTDTTLRYDTKHRILTHIYYYYICKREHSSLSMLLLSSR